MSIPQVGDIYRRPNGKLFKVVSICEQPSMTLEEIAPAAVLLPASGQWSTSTPERISGAIGAAIFAGLVRLVPEVPG